MKTIIIAEAGVNHNGSLDIAKRLIESASVAGADMIKFQTFKAGNVVSKDAKQADYQKRNLGNETSQYDMLKDIELSSNDHKALVKHCKKFNIEFFSTAFDMESIILLESIKMPIWKIPSGEITNLPYIKKIGSFGKPVILSTGMATMGEIEAAIGLIEAAGTSRDKITVLHCTTDYPASPDEINLSAMQTIGNAFKVRYGYSDHSEGIEISLAAVAMGASIIEKHFTLDKKMKGPDHKASLEPYEMKQLIDGIRKIERAIGNGIKIPSTGEMKNKNLVRKSIVASRAIRKGEKFSDENITVKRPGDGLSPMIWEHVIGLKAGKSYLKDEKIRL